MQSLKLTPTVVQNALNVVSPEGLLTLLLRNRRILYIENLEYTKDVFPVIDLTNNEIVELGGIPELPGLEVLLLANNNISRVGLVAAYGIRSLLLMNNTISSFAEVAKLRNLSKLENLMMLGNKIVDEHHYRLFMVWLFPKLKVLDCLKIKQKDRNDANELFGPNYENRLPAADALINGNKTVEPVLKETRIMETTLKKLLSEEKTVLVQELEKATSMEEIERISEALKLGYVNTSTDP